VAVDPNAFGLSDFAFPLGSGIAPSPPPPPPPPDNLAEAVLTAVRDVVALASAPEVDDARVYRRAYLDFVARRDGVPGVVCAGAPGRTVGRSDFTTEVRRVTYPVTVMLVDAQGQNPQLSPAWRAGWGDRVLDALVGERTLAAVPEVFEVNPATYLVPEETAYEQAGLWASAVSVEVVCLRAG
jgi:hypothetical protein